MKEREKRIIRKLAYIPMIVVMCIIFLFSSDTGKVSSSKSDGIAEYVREVMDALHIDVSQADVQRWHDTVTFLIRKTAHMAEYAILACCIFFGIRIDTGKMPTWYWVIAIAALYATTDEVHQLFVPGRSGQFRDICIDSIGATIGYIILWFLVKKYYNKRKKQIKYK